MFVVKKEHCITPEEQLLWNLNENITALSTTLAKIAAVAIRGEPQRDAAPAPRQAKKPGRPRKGDT